MSDPIRVGDPFPDFELPDQNGEPIRLAELRGRPSVIYFYPKDDTGGCTAQACGLRDRMGEFAGAQVIGVSPDGVRSHAKFAQKYDLNFRLAADPDRVLIDRLGLWVEKQLYGKKYFGVERTTYVLDAEGVVTHIFRKVKPQGHEQEVLAALR